ncbi:MAG: hypothetical protein ABIH89_06725 [Elusimicrobiota bacterium]
MNRSLEKVIITCAALLLLMSCGEEDKEKLEKKLSKTDLSGKKAASFMENISLSGEMAKLPDIAGTKIPDVPFEASGLKFDLKEMEVNINPGIQEVQAITGVKNSLKALDAIPPKIKLEKGLPAPVLESTFQVPKGPVLTIPEIPDIPDIDFKDLKDIVIPEITPVFNVTGIDKDIPEIKTEVSKTEKKKKKKK